MGELIKAFADAVLGDDDNQKVAALPATAIRATAAVGAMGMVLSLT